jgi:hypothetical protein
MHLAEHKTQSLAGDLDTDHTTTTYWIWPHHTTSGPTRDGLARALVELTGSCRIKTCTVSSTVFRAEPASTPDTRVLSTTTLEDMAFAHSAVINLQSHEDILRHSCESGLNGT